MSNARHLAALVSGSVIDASKIPTVVKPPAASRLTASGSGVNGGSLGATGGSQTHTLTSAQAPSHTHSGSTSTAGDHAHTANINTGGNQYYGSVSASVQDGVNMYSGVPTSSAGSHTHNISIDSHGGGQAHNNTQPTIVLNYIIKT